MAMFTRKKSEPFSVEQRRRLNLLVYFDGIRCEPDTIAATAEIKWIPGYSIHSLVFTRKADLQSHQRNPNYLRGRFLITAM